MAVSKQPSITPETSSGEGLDEEPSSRGEAKWKRFHPFRVVRKIFRRRVKRQGTGEETETSKKSWSTSELQSVQDIPGKYEAPSPPYKIGLSVSHDSIFSPESSNLVGSEELNRPQGSTLSMQHAGIKNMFKDELFSRVRARRDSDDDDIGLPHSPCTSPTTVDVLTQGLKSRNLKSQTACSAGSLLSMGSSENDEDSAMASSSGHSSRMSLLDRRSLDFEGDPDLSQPIPLNHQAAHHRIAVRPKRTHGLPQKRLKQLAASKLNTLPATPEVTEYLKAESTTTIITSTASMHQISKIFTSASHENTFASSTSEKMTESKSSNELSHSQFDRQEFHVKRLSNNLIYSLQSDDKIVDATASRHNEIAENYLEGNSVNSSSRETYRNVSKDHQTQVGVEIQAGSCKPSSEPKGMSDGNHPHNSSSKPEESQLFEDNLVPSQPLRVSALIKNIEQSDSVVKHAENVLDDAGPLTEDGILTNSAINLLEAKDIATSEMESSPQVNAAHHSEITTGTSKPIDLASRMANMCFDEFKSKPDTNNSLNLSMNQYDAISRENSQMEREIRQQFEQQKITTQQSSSSGTMSHLYPEEESIMSDKCVTSLASGKLAHENSKVSISHHSLTHSSISQREKVTEARNLITVDETFNLNVQGYPGSSSSDGRQQNSHQTEPWISSFDISSPATDVTVNSVTSNIYSQKLTEDRVTISINSGELKTNTPKKQPDEVLSNGTAAGCIPKECKSSNKPTLPNPVPNLKSKSEEKVRRPESKKSPSPDSHSRKPCPKNIPKKVSVEIVPFSQRMKDKNYQPLSFSNKNSTPEVPKLNPVIAVERNLSERRISPKGKDSEKSNNRHSFSGALPADVERHIISPTEKKSAGKLEKMHYPVQIRIHKSKVDEKENSCEKLNPNRVDPKLHSDILKSLKEQKHGNDLQPKWEVKVQSSSQIKETTQNEIKKALSESKTIMSRAADANESRDLIPSPNDLPERETSASPSTESASSKGKESTRKPLRETTTLSKDSEPELLRVFARRSIKQKHCDKDKQDDRGSEANDTPLSESPSSLDSFENYRDDADLNMPVSNATSKLSDSVERPKSISPEVVRKKSKSFSEKEKPTTPLPLKDTSINRRPSFKALTPEVTNIEMENTFQHRQRTASEPDVPVTLPPTTDSLCLRNCQNSTLEKNMLLACKNDQLQRTASLSISPPPPSLSNGTSCSIRADLDKGKENPDPSAPSWLQLAQQRREMREQRERLLLGSSTNSFLDASSKPSRSSKVWDMVNNFQKLQMT